MTPCRQASCPIYDPAAAIASHSSSVPPIPGRPRSWAPSRSYGVSADARAEVRVLCAVVAGAIAAIPASAATAPVVVLDPGHDLRANPATEPIGPGSSKRKIKDGGGTRGVVSGLTEAELNLRVSLRLRSLLESGRQGRDDADGNGGNQHRQRRPRPDRQRDRRGALPPRSRRRLDGPARSRHAHAAPRASSWLDGRRLRLEQARRADRAVAPGARTRFP